VSDRLRDRLIARIRERGPLLFDEFMEAALYDPEDGFFSSVSPARPEGHFVTSPHLSPVFAGLLTVQARDAWNTLGRPDPFTVVDLGAGEGMLARGMLTAAASDEDFARALHLVAVERGEIARNALSSSGLDVAAKLQDVEPFTGLIVANELFDNVPFRLFVDDIEITVTVEGARLIWQPLPMSDIRTVSPASDQIVTEVARALRLGYALIIDYGFAGSEKPEMPRGYRDHHLIEDVLEAPGSNDITGPVDFDALAARAASSGLQVWGPVSQRDAMMSLGYRATLDRMRADQAEKELTGEWRTAIEYYGERGQAAMLVDPAGLGSLKVLALGTDGLPAPRVVV
jgi:NADH dehydrogenase [ubiquinone] 1 alpha subcomplex assembly factor 7